jgi:hypothetical protein
MKDEKTIRIIAYNSNLDKVVNYAYLPDPITLDVIGYLEVSKGYGLQNADTLPEFREYVDENPAVFYTKFFDDKIEDLPDRIK